jgi:hypothetical protein
MEAAILEPSPFNTATISPTPEPTQSQLSTPLPSTAPKITGSNCTMSTTEEGIELFRVPYFQDRRILPTMEPDYAYTAAETFPTMVRLLRDGETAGWVDYRLTAVSLQGSDCLETQYSGDLTDFMDYLCFVVANPPTDTYMDSEFTEPSGMMISSDPVYVVTVLGKQGPLGSCVGHAGPCFSIDPTTVNLVGNCDDLPRSGQTTSETQLWSQPDGSAGAPIHDLAAGQFLAVQYGEDTAGAAPPGAPTPGKWLHVKLSGFTLPRHGWVWSQFVSYR